MAEMQKTIAAENSDVVFASPPVACQVQADRAKAEVDGWLGKKQRAFVEFVLGQYVAHTVENLDLEKLPALLRLMYGRVISDAIAELGSPEENRRLLAEFQEVLYQEAA